MKVGGWTVDFLWRVERLAVETDSYRYHRGHIAFQDDHARELGLRRVGYEVRRFDERQINEEPGGGQPRRRPLLRALGIDTLFRQKRWERQLDEVTDVEVVGRNGDPFAGEMRKRLGIRTADGVEVFVVNRLEEKLLRLRPLLLS